MFVFRSLSICIYCAYLEIRQGGGHMRGSRLWGRFGGSPPEAERILQFQLNPVHVGL